MYNLKNLLLYCFVLLAIFEINCFFHNPLCFLILFSFSLKEFLLFFPVICYTYIVNGRSYILCIYLFYKKIPVGKALIDIVFLYKVRVHKENKYDDTRT